jgi:predicted porin
MLGLSAQVGAQGRALGSFQQMRPGGDFKEGAHANQTISSFGYSYRLSNRTEIYATCSNMQVTGMNAGVNSQIISTGIVHNF